MRCFVTGATGHIGSHLVRHLLERNVEVAALVRPRTSNLWRIEDILGRLHVIKGDLSHIDHSSTAIREFAPEIVIHLGWHGVSSGYRNDPAQITQNLYGSLKLLQLAHEGGCQKWVGLGSQAEYGPSNEVLTEDLPTRPVTTYGVVKLCLGLLSQKLCEAYGIGFAWLRLTASYGPMDDYHHMIPELILKLLRGQKPALTLGEQRWDYLYAEDAVEAIWQAAITPEARGIFNLGSGEAHTIRSITERVRDLIDPNLPLGFGEVPYRPDQVMHLQADISRLREATGWSPRVSLDEGLRRTVEWFMENRWRYE
jgi:nucleoside-diphosphate-sugar epimerase